MIPTIIKEDNMEQMRPFNKYDWYELAGAERFPDGSEPLVASYGDNTSVIVDKHGVQAFFMDDDCYVQAQVDIPVCKEFGILIANKILCDIEGMTSDQVIEYLNTHGSEL